MKEIVLEGDEPEAVEWMLRWLYTREYGKSSQPARTPSILVAMPWEG